MTDFPNTESSPLGWLDTGPVNNLRKRLKKHAIAGDHRKVDALAEEIKQLSVEAHRIAYAMGEFEE